LTVKEREWFNYTFAGWTPIYSCRFMRSGINNFIENKREWLVTLIKLNDKDDFMSRKKIIMIFDTWIVLWRLEGKRIGLTADRRRLIKPVESSSSQFRRL
jgi:hypothetical protein